MKPFQDAAKDIIEAGKVLYAMGMVPATSGNFSMRVEGGNIAVTVSGRHKGQLTADGVMLVDMQGQALDDRRPSAETGLRTCGYITLSNY